MAKASSKSVSRSRPKPAATKTSAKKAPAARKPLPKSLSKSLSKSLPKAAVKPAAKSRLPAPARKPATRAVAVASGKWVFTFGDGRAEGKSAMRELLGGKGANLAEMANLGLPVPPGFTLPTSVCNYYYDNKKTYPKDLKAQVEKALDYIGKLSGKTFGDASNPLLVSVRSGARASMPGMMDTVLNLGLNDRTVLGLSKSSGDERFAYDSYRRFIQIDRKSVV